MPLPALLKTSTKTSIYLTSQSTSSSLCMHLDEVSPVTHDP